MILKRRRWARVASLMIAGCLLLLITGTLAATANASPVMAVAAPILKWQRGGCQTTWCRTGWYASPAVADLDGDAKPEVIWTDYRIVVVNGEDGSDQWVVPNPGGGRGWPSVVVADLDGDSALEIVTAHGDGWVGVHRWDGSAFSGWPRQITSGNELRSLAVADVEGDGNFEILACSTRSDHQWFLLEHTGVVRTGWPVHWPDSNSNGYAAGCFNQNVGLADLDRDGRAEMIGPNDTHYIVGYQDDANPMYANSTYGLVNGENKPWARVGFHLEHAVDLRGYANCTPGQEPLEPRPNFANSAPALVDVDGDGILEIIVVGNQYDCRNSPYTSLFHTPYILNADRTRWAGDGFDWQTLPLPDLAANPLAEDWHVIETAQPNPVVADLDGDGQREILYASYDGRVHAYWLDKTEHGDWPFEVTQPGEGFIRFASEPAVVDIDADGQAEVIFATWTQKGSGASGQMVIVDSAGRLLHAVDLPRGDGTTWDGALGAPTVANIDNDPDLEVILGTANTGLVAYDLPGSSSARLLWGTSRGSYLRSGALPGETTTFLDVPSTHWAWQWIEALYASGVTAGCSTDPLRYCPESAVTRAEMSVFLKKGIHGSTYTPPAPDSSHTFSDISGHWAEAWIEDLFDEGFTSGFPDGTYRPDNQVTRAEIAVFLKKAIHGSAYTSPTPDGSHPFSDVAGHWAEAWIEDLYDEGITTGFPDGTYRPENQVTRAEMAVFLVNAFSLPLP